MKKVKINLDRKPLNSGYIESKQNFDQVLAGFKQIKPPIWKNPWFYGPVGVASLALIVSLSMLNSNNDINENKSTLNTSSVLPDDTECIHPLSKNVDKKFTSYEIIPSQEQTIILPSGTSVTIPKGSLMPSSPDQKVEIKIREFTDQASSFGSGIPMDYKTKDAFESAGMIEIRGTQDGKLVPISSSKPIEVSLVLIKDASSFGFWKLDEEKKDWVTHPATYSQTENNFNTANPTLSKIEINKQIVSLDLAISKVDISLNKLVEPSKVDYFLPIEGNQRFDLAFDQKEFPELEKFKGMEFEVVSKKAYDKSFTKKTWSSVDLVKENDSYYALFTSKTDKFKINVRPVLNGKKKEEAETTFDASLLFCKNKKQELIEEKRSLLVKKEEQQIKFDALLKSFNKEEAVKNANKMAIDNELNTADFYVNSFGVYNCDNPNPYPIAFKEEPVFTYSGGNSIEIVSAFVFDKKKDTRFSFGKDAKHSISQLGCYEGNSNTLVVIDSYGRLGYISSFDNNSIKDGKLKVNLIDKSDENIDFLQKIINGKTITT